MRFSRLLALASIGVACLCAQMEPRAQSGHSGNLGPPVLRGILLDAGCRDRANVNLRAHAETLQAEAPVEPPNAAANNPPVAGAVAAKGIAVDSATISAERAGVMEIRVPGLMQRQSDPTCAITGSTTSFALLTDSGRLLDLDEGGNTLALQAVETSAGGRALLNGQGPGVKPRVVVKGWIRNGGKLITLDLSPAG